MSNFEKSVISKCQRVSDTVHETTVTHRTRIEYLHLMFCIIMFIKDCRMDTSRQKSNSLSTCCLPSCWFFDRWPRRSSHWAVQWVGSKSHRYRGRPAPSTGRGWLRLRCWPGYPDHPDLAANQPDWVVQQWPQSPASSVHFAIWAAWIGLRADNRADPLLAHSQFQTHVEKANSRMASAGLPILWLACPGGDIHPLWQLPNHPR